MSFTSEVKKEICMNILLDHCMKAELSAFLQMCSTLNITNQGLSITCKSENVSSAKRIFQLVKELYKVDIEISVIKKMTLRKNNIYYVKIKERALDILQDLDILSDEGLKDHPSNLIVKKECCARAYLAGAFLASGSVNSPNTSNYHLEISTTNKPLAKYIQRQMKKFNMNAKLIKRRNQEVVYLKAGDQISDFLKCVGTNDSLFRFEDSRIQRDFMNNLTRLDNCELANEMKSIKTGKKQLEDIERIENFVGLNNLHPNLLRVANLRKENPEASLNELCDLYENEYGDEISKSGMRHRLNKIKDIASQYKNV